MKVSLCLYFLLGQAFAIWPAPVSYTHGSTALWISKDFNVTYNGGDVCWIPHAFYHPSFSLSDTEQILRAQCPTTGGLGTVSNISLITSTEIVQSAVQRAFITIFDESFIPWKLHPRNGLSKFEPNPNTTYKSYVTSLAITQTSVDNSSTFKPLAGQVDESYNLTVTEAGLATIVAKSSIGVLRALETFTQLFYEHSQKNAGFYTPLAPVAIYDAPKFAHRGLNMDVARNWYPKDSILRTIDAISWNKFNRLHLHITDAQSWPIDIPALPELSQKGAYQTGLSYTPEDIAEIQTYAVYRGVELYMEIDMPGHTSSIGLAYPELITALDAHPWDTYCAEPPCGELKLNSSAVYDFLETLFDDLLPRVSPYSAYFHTGGDEVNAQAYLLDDTVLSNETAVLTPLLQKLLDRNHDQVRAAGLTPVVWEEMLLDWNLTLGNDVVVQTWISDESLTQVVNKGHKAIFGNYNYWYLDCGKGQWLDFANGDSFQTYYPFQDYCAPLKNWRLIYSYDPLAGLTEAQAELVLGGEVHIWSEQTDPINLDDMVWPRASAAGEILWSGRQDASGQNRSQLDASPRLAEMRERMVAKGVSAGPVQMVFCTQNNATECSL